MRIDWHEDALRDLKRLDRSVQQRIVDYVDQLGREPDPRPRAEPYRSELRDLWKLRVSDYRLVCKIEQQQPEIRILILAVGHRSKVYKTRSIRRARRRNRRS